MQITLPKNQSRRYRSYFANYVRRAEPIFRQEAIILQTHLAKGETNIYRIYQETLRQFRHAIDRAEEGDLEMVQASGVSEDLIEAMNLANKILGYDDNDDLMTSVMTALYAARKNNA